MAQPSPAKLQYMVKAAPQPRPDEKLDESTRYFHVLSDADRQLQELEAQRILERVRQHAAAHKARRPWGAPRPQDGEVRRSLSRPLLSPSVAVHTTMTHDPATRSAARAASRSPDLASMSADLGASTTLRTKPSAGASVPASPMRAQVAKRPSSAYTPMRATRRGQISRPASAVPADAKISARHVNKLEEEVSHLRETIDILLASTGSESPRAGGRGTAGAAAVGHAAQRSRLDKVVAEHTQHMEGLEEVLDAARAAEERVLALEQQRRKAAVTTTRLARQSGIDIRRDFRAQPRQQIESKESESAEGESKEDTRSASASATTEPRGPPAADSAAAVGADALSTARITAEPGATSTVRPASAHPSPARSLSRTKEYSLARPSSAGAETISKRRAREEQQKREEEERAHQSYKFKAQPIPDSTKVAMFSTIMARMEMKRKLKHEARFDELQQQLRPFEHLSMHEQQMAARAAATRARFELSTSKELAEARKFHAVPVPASIHNPDSEYVQLVQREKERPARVAQYARALAAGASLPPRMALAEEAEKKKRAERAAKIQLEEMAERRLSQFQANDLPDFDHLHGTFVSKLSESRKAFALTTPTPFRFDSEERKAAERQRRQSRQLAADLATSQSQVLRSRSRSLGPDGLATVDFGLTGGSAHSAFALGASGARRGRPSSASARGPGATMLTTRSLEPEEVAQKLAVSTAPPAAMTKTVQLRMLEVQRRVREQQEHEQKLAKEEEERLHKLREATHHVAPVVARLEAQRVPVPLAWQMDSATASASMARKRFEREAAERERFNRERVREAERARPMLMLRSTLERQREDARRDALISSAASVGAPADMHWRDVAHKGGLEGAHMYTEDDRELMDVSQVSGRGEYPRSETQVATR